MRAAKKGFTLIELMIVVLIIAVLAAVITPKFFGVTAKAKRARAEADIHELESACERFKLDVGRYPENLQELLEKPADDEEDAWHGPYVGNRELLDPWQNEYIYEYPGTNRPESFDIASFGADGKEGGEGEDADVTNW